MKHAGPLAAPLAAPVAAIDPNAPSLDINAVQEVIETVRSLTEVLARETELLRALQIREFSALQDKKLALVETYEIGARALQQNPGFVASLDPRLRGELRDIAERMQAVTKENGIAIVAAQEVNQRVASAIVEAVHANKPEADVYSEKGGYQKNKQTPPVSIQIDGRF